MPRKGENIYKRKDGRWEGRYIKGRRPDGKALYGSVYGRKYGEVREKLLPLKSAYAARDHTKVSFIGTVWDWLVYWLECFEKPYIKSSTYASYCSKLKNHVLPVLGEKKLEKLNENDIQNWIDGLLVKGLSGNSARTVFRILNAALQKAVHKHYLFVDPCRDIVLPGVEPQKIRALTLAKQKELEKQAFESVGNEAVVLALYTGMRVGEISALRWSDIDFESNQICVCQTLQRIMNFDGGKAKTKIIMDIPKSDTSYRIIPFSSHLKALLLDWKAVSDSDYVVSCKGHYAEPRVISYRFRKIADKAGLTSLTFHGLRHTYATRCMEQGTDVVTLSRLLGHASSKMTLDTYADSMMEQRKSAMLVLDMLLSKDRTQGEDNRLLITDSQKMTGLIRQLFS